MTSLIQVPPVMAESPIKRVVSTNSNLPKKKDILIGDNLAS